MKIMLNKLTALISLCIFLSVMAISNADQLSPEPGGDYATDKANQTKRMDHASIQALNMISFLMCVSENGGENYPNSNYNAKVDENQCLKLRGDSIDPNNVSGAVELSDISVSCSTASSASPQNCKGVFKSQMGTNYLVYMTVTTAPTDARPNGEFTMYWCGADSTDKDCKAGNHSLGTLIVAVNGSNETEVIMYDEFPNDSGTVSDTDNSYEWTSLKLTLSNHKLNSASGTIKTYTWIDDNATAAKYDLDFNSTKALIEKDDSGSPSCFNLASQAEYPQQYDLYDKVSGARKLLSGGVPIKLKTTTGTGTVGTRGWLDYWGADLNGNAALLDGDTVTVQSGTVDGVNLKDVDLTLDITNGMLEEKTGFTGTLPSTDWSNDDTGRATSTLMRYFGGQEVPIYIDVDDAKVRIAVTTVVGASTFSAGSDVTTNSALGVWNGSSVSNDNFSAYSGALGTWFNLTNLSNKTFTARTYEKITPGLTTSNGINFSTDQYFKCYGSDCPFPTQDGSSANVSGYNHAQFQNATSFSYINPNGGTPQFYKFDASEMMFYLCQGFSSGTCTGDSYPVVCDTSIAACTAGNHMGSPGYTRFHASGFVAHDAVGTDGNAINNWDDINATSMVTYQWMTSDNLQRSRLKLAKKSDGSYVNFTKPLQFTFIPDSGGGDDRNAVAPTSPRMTLTYQGNGELHGFRWKQNSEGNWRPSNTIKDATLVDTDRDGTTDHVVLARRMETEPATLSASSCTDDGLSVSTSATFLTSAPAEVLSNINYSVTDMGNLTYIANGAACVVNGAQQSAIEGCVP